MNYSDTEEHKIKSHKLRNLRNHECDLVHCARGFPRWPFSSQTFYLPRLRCAGGAHNCKATESLKMRDFGLRIAPDGKAGFVLNKNITESYTLATRRDTSLPKLLGGESRAVKIEGCSRA